MNTVLNRTYRAEFVKTLAAIGTPERLTSRAVTSIFRNGGTPRCTVTIINGHGYTPGAIVHFAGATEPEFNVVTRVAGVIDDNTFYVLIPGASGASSGAVTCYADIWVRQATVLGKRAARTANTGVVYLGTKPTNDGQPFEIAINGEASLPAGQDGTGPLVNLADWYVDAATAADGIYVLYF